MGKQYTGRCAGRRLWRSRLLLLATVSVGALTVAAGGPAGSARADDVDIATGTNNGINLDFFSGATVKVFPGVTVTDTTFTINCSTFSSLCATNQAWTLTNQGTIGPANFGDGVHFTAGGAVVNSGSIDGGNGIWIVGGTSASVDNQLGANIHGTTGAIVIGTFANPVPGMVTNAGTITSDGQAVGLTGGTVINLATGVIIGHGGSNAVSLVLGASRTVINSGYIQSNDSGFGTGVAVQNGTITNNATGQILGAYNAIWANGSNATSITNAGLLEASKAQGSGSAIEVDGGGTIVNSGIIRSNTSNSTTTDSGINFTGAGSITNSGTIESLSGGLALRFNGAATHTLNLDTGSILGGNARGGTGTDNLVLLGTGTEAISKFLAFEMLSMQGSDWTLTDNGIFTTSATVQGGILRVNGQLTSPAVTVQSAGTLAGTGTVVGTVTNNGNIAPGNSIGTLNITGNYTQATGSTYTVEVNTAPASDLILITGAATIQSGATVSVLAAPGFYALGTRYTILNATLGVTGTYSTLRDNAPFVDFVLNYDANNVFLDVLRSSALFSDIAQTPNQKATAGALQNFAAGNPIFDALVMLDTPTALHAFDLLSGEIHASARGVMLDQSHFVRDAIIGRLLQFPGSVSAPFAPGIAAITIGAADDDLPAGVLAYAGGARLPVGPAMPASRVMTAWAQAFGNWGRTNGDGNAATFKSTTGGFITGIDATFKQSWRFGLAGGYQSTSLDVADRGSSARIETYHLAAYGGMQRGSFGTRFGAAYSWNRLASARQIAFPGFTDATSANYAARTAQVFGEAGYGTHWGATAVEPFAGLAYVNLHTDGFTESGGPAALTAASGGDSATFSTLGMRASHMFALDAVKLTARGTLGWRHAFGNLTPTSSFAFSGGNGVPFAIAGVPITSNVLLAEAGVDAELTQAVTAGISYSGQFASSKQEHAVKGRLSARF